MPTETSTATRPTAFARLKARASAIRGKDGAVRLPSETTTFVFAVSVAVALGVTCGAWINARLASAASIKTAPPSRLLPASRATAQEPPALAAASEPRPAGSEANAAGDPEVKASEDEAAPSSSEPAREPDEPSGAKASGERHEASADEGGARRHADDAGAAPQRARQATSPSSSDADVSRGGGSLPGANAAARAQGRATPCALYVSSGSLSLRNGGAATIVIGGPGVQGRVTATTPDWSDITVFNEGQAGGQSGWVKYSVRSVSRRSGVYAIHFQTPCGAQTIPVTVARP